MFSEPGDGVLIANGHSGVRLCRAGNLNELGYPTLIDGRAGRFTGSVRDDTVGPYSAFQDQLAALYATLSGTAKLGSYDGFGLVLSGNGRGAISVYVEMVAEHGYPVRLTFEFGIDQTYLPEIIRRIGHDFPSK